MKFKVGEIAIAIMRGSGPCNEEVEIVAVGPFQKGQCLSAAGIPRVCGVSGDYLIKRRGGELKLTLEPWLRKRPGDDKKDYIPASIRQIFKAPQKEKA